jgi:hypothetical protein
MCELSEIEAMLRAHEEGLCSSIMRSLGSSAVTLFGVFDEKGKDRLELVGSGTLVLCGESHYILTAAHVWEKVLKSAVKVGITMTDNIDHQHLTDVAAIIPTTLPLNDAGWNEWGPDLAMLRIPPERVGGIKAYHVFEDVQAPPRLLGVDCLECWFVMGTPKELGVFTQSHADVQTLMCSADPQPHECGEHDYFDLLLDTNALNMPKSFGGLSGGGLWRVMVYCSPTTGKVDWAQRLKGVAFWEFPPENSHRAIRCHGPKSIAALAGLVVTG